MKLIGYSYDAAEHCESCSLDYARSIPYTDYYWGDGFTDEDIESHNPGIISLDKAINLGVIRDSEGNTLHAIFDTNESDTPGSCDDCGTYLDTAWTSDCVQYVMDALWDAVDSTVRGAETANVKVLDQWREKFKWVSSDRRGNFITDCYDGLLNIAPELWAEEKT